MLPLAALALGQAALGLGQAALSGRKQKEAELNDLAGKSPLASGSKSLNDYYNQALNRANENVYNSAPFLMSKQEANRNLMSSIGAAQDRRGGIGAIGKADLMRTDALNRAIMNAESVKGANISRLGQAAQAKSAEDKYLFDINKMTPYNRKFGLKQMEAQAANERFNAGVQMAGSAASNYAMGSMMNKATPNVSGVAKVPSSVSSGFDSFMTDRPELNAVGSVSIPQTAGLPSYQPRISYSLGDYSFGKNRQATVPYTRTNLPSRDLTNLQLNYR